MRIGVIFDIAVHVRVEFISIVIGSIGFQDNDTVVRITLAIITDDDIFRLRTKRKHVKAADDTLCCILST